MADRRKRGPDRLHGMKHSTLEDSSRPMDDEMLFRSVTGATTAQEEERLAEWLLASEENTKHLRAVTDVLGLTADADDDMSFGPAPTGQALLESRRLAERARRERLRGWRASVLVAAAIAIVAFAAPLAQRLLGPDSGASMAGFGADEFTTETEPATVGLRDGTVVRLAPRSRLRLHGPGDAREVSLAGRGYFAVAHDPEAPFTIRGEAGTVTVLGTRFELTTDGDDLRLIVVEGLVRLTVRGSVVEVGAGELAQVIDGNLVPLIKVADAESLIDWVGDFIVFQDTPLRTVAREIERRHGVRIELDDPSLGDRTVTALFAGRSFDEIAQVICVVAQLQCTMVSDGVLKMATPPDRPSPQNGISRTSPLR